MVTESIVLLLVCVLVFGGFTYKCYRKLPFEYDFKFVRRIYYLFVILFISAVTCLYEGKIKNITVISIDKNNQILLNNALFIAFLFLLFVIWEHLFISCSTFKVLRFKDVEITFDDRQKVQYVDKLQENQIESLYAVLNAKIKMSKYIDYYVENKELDPQISYFDILKEYGKKRRNVAVDCYSMDSDGLNQLQRDCKLTSEQLSSIVYSINLCGFCRPKEFRRQSYIFALVKTIYIETDIIVVLKSDLLIDKENLVIIDIIDYYELLVSNKILEAKIQCTKTE
jgi:hypothetical protein